MAGMVVVVPFTIDELKKELQSDPNNLGFASAITAGDENAVADLLNAKRSGGGYQVDRDPVTPSEVFAAMDPGDFALLTTTDLARLQVILSVPRIDLTVSSIQTMVTNVFTLGAVSRQSLVLLQKREGSRAEVLWGPGTVVTTNQVDAALHT